MTHEHAFTEYHLTEPGSVYDSDGKWVPFATTERVWYTGYACACGEPGFRLK